MREQTLGDVKHVLLHLGFHVTLVDRQAQVRLLLLRVLLRLQRAGVRSSERQQHLVVLRRDRRQRRHGAVQQHFDLRAAARQQDARVLALFIRTFAHGKMSVRAPHTDKRMQVLHNELPLTYRRSTAKSVPTATCQPMPLEASIRSLVCAASSRMFLLLRAAPFTACRHNNTHMHTPTHQLLSDPFCNLMCARCVSLERALERSAPSWP